MTTIPEARAKVRAALTAVTNTLTTAERDEWVRELELLREVETSLTTRLVKRMHPRAEVSR